MLLQFCDKCGRPLSEGCIARGEAVDRDGELVCASCLANERTKSAVRAAESDVGQETTGPLGHYEQAVWGCESCGIPVTALDLIEGRGSRVGGMLRCSRCAPIAKKAPEVPKAEPKPTAPARPSLPRSAPSIPRAAQTPRVLSTPRHSTAAANQFLAEAKSEQKRPILPIVMIAIVLPMFAVSLYFAITSQQKLNEAMGRQANAQVGTGEPTDRRNQRPREELNPEPLSGGPDDTPPEVKPPLEDTNPPTARPLPPGVMDDLIAIENELAEPAIAKLQSKNLGEVWEALIEIGSRRLIAARPYVRALLRDPDDKTRALACRVAGMLNDKEALPTLNRMLELDPDDDVKVEARKARDRMTGEATRELRDMTDAELQEMLADIQRELDRRRGRND